MLISSHQLGELEALCERYVYIDGGQLAESFAGQEAQSVIVKLTQVLTLTSCNPSYQKM